MNNGGSPIVEYRIQQITGGSDKSGGTVVQSATNPNPVPGNAVKAVVTGLKNGTTYRFVVTAVNSSGVSVASARSNAVTPDLAAGAPPVIDLAPFVVARKPAIGATKVAVSSNVTATFSEAVKGIVPAAGAPATFTLRADDSSDDVVAVVTYNATTRVATLNPTRNLAKGKVYWATLTGGITDATGKPLTQVSWSFKTS